MRITRRQLVHRLRYVKNGLELTKMNPFAESVFFVYNKECKTNIRTEKAYQDSLTTNLRENRYFVISVMSFPNSDLFLEDLDEPLPVNSGTRETLDDKILGLRNQLRDSYDILIKTRDTLANISFEKMKRKEGEEQVKGVFENDVDEVLNASSLKESLSRLNTKIRSRARQSGQDGYGGYLGTSVSEVNTFFRALDDLDEGIRKIEVHKSVLRSLNSDVKKAISGLEVDIEQTKEELVVLDSDNN